MNKEKIKNQNHIKWITLFYKEKIGLIFLLFVLTLLSSFVAIAYPYFSKKLLDTLQLILASKGSYNNPMQEIDKLLLLLFAIGIGSFLSSAYPGIRGAVNCVFENTIRTKYFKKILGKDHKFFSKFETGDIVTRITDDIYDYPKLSWFLCSGIFRAVESISKVLFCITAMVLINWKLTIYALIPIPIMLAIYYWASDKIYDTYEKNQEAISKINAQLEMSFSGVRVIKAYACEDKYKRFFDTVLRKRWHTEMDCTKLDVVMTLFYQCVDYVAQTCIIFAGGIMAVKGEITIGTFYAFYTYLSMLVFPILDIPKLFVSGKRAYVNIDRLEELSTFEEPKQPAKQEKLSELKSIEFSNVNFSYGDRVSNALENVSFKIEEGETIGIIGSIGSGKSTIIKSILGLLVPTSGDIKVNGRSMSSINLQDLRNHIGYVPQEALLFSGTLRENIDFAIDNLSDEDFAFSVHAAQMQEEMESFSEKEKTVVGQRGISLSGGQKQRMAIARAIAKKPELLLFDDITASLDATNEENLMCALDTMSENMSKKLTKVIVSHRLSTLQYVDKVLFLDNGKVIGFGTHDELLALVEYKNFVSEITSLHPEQITNNVKTA